MSKQWEGVFDRRPLGGLGAGPRRTQKGKGSAQASNAGTYFAVVTDVYGTATSTNAVLSVTNPPPPAFGSVAVDGSGGVHLVLDGPVGDVFRILGSTNLVDWQTVATVTNVTGTVEYVDGRRGLGGGFTGW